MVGRDVEQHRYIWLEGIDIIQLKGANFHHIPVGRLLIKLLCERVADVAHHAHIQPGIFEQVVGKLGGVLLPLVPVMAMIFPSPL